MAAAVLTWSLVVLTLVSHSAVGKNHYEVLGVKKDADLAELRRAYHRKALECHPDKKPGDPDAHAQFLALSASYAVVSDAELREMYDAELMLEDALQIFLDFAESMQVFIASLAIDQLLTADGLPDWAEISLRLGRMGELGLEVASNTTSAVGRRSKAALGQVSDAVANFTEEVSRTLFQRMEIVREVPRRAHRQIETAREALADLAQGTRQRAETIRARASEHQEAIGDFANQVAGFVANVARTLGQDTSDAVGQTRRKVEEVMASVAKALEQDGRPVDDSIAQTLENITRDAQSRLQAMIGNASVPLGGLVGDVKRMVMQKVDALALSSQGISRGSNVDRSESLEEAEHVQMKAGGGGSSGFVQQAAQPEVHNRAGAPMEL